MRKNAGRGVFIFHSEVRIKHNVHCTVSAAFKRIFFTAPCHIYAAIRLTAALLSRKTLQPAIVLSGICCLLAYVMVAILPVSCVHRISLFVALPKVELDIFSLQ